MAAKAKPADVLTKIVDLLTPLTPEDRARVISASLTLLGDAPVRMPRREAETPDSPDEDSEATPAAKGKARVWQKQNSITDEQLAAAFHDNDGKIEVIADVAGKNKKEKTLNAYVLAGIAKILESGEPKFSDKDARALCTSAGCYDGANHAATLKDKGNWFTGSKDKGWALTGPGLKHGASLVKGPTATIK